MAEAAPGELLHHPTQDRILDEAERLFAARGFAGLGLAELAERVGISKSSLFHHFPSKIEIYASVLERLFERLWSEMQARVDPKAGPLGRLEQMIDVITEFLGANPNTARLLLRSMIERDFEDAGVSREELLARHGQYVSNVMKALIEVVRDGVARGVFRKQPAGQFVQTVVGGLLFHFASGELGRELLGGDVFDPRRVESRKRELKAQLRDGLLRREG